MKKILAALIMGGFISITSAQNFSTVYQWMFANGLTTMSSESAFRSNDTVTRGEIAKFFTKFGEIQKLTKSKSANECQFKDVVGYDSTLIPHIISACEYGLVKGSAGNYFPNKAITEAEALTVVVRAMMGMQDETRDPWWSEYYELGKGLNILDNESVGDLNKNALRGKIGTWLWRTTKGIVYNNSQYGFSLTFPATWEGYIVKNRSLDRGLFGKSDSLDFGLPAQESIFNVSIHPKAQRQQISSEKEGPKPIYVGENDQYVFSYGIAQDAVNDTIIARMQEVSNIIKTIKTTH